MKISSATGLRVLQYSGPGLVSTWLTTAGGFTSSGLWCPLTRIFSAGDSWLGGAGGSSALAAIGAVAAAPPPT